MDELKHGIAEFESALGSYVGPGVVISAFRVGAGFSAIRVERVQQIDAPDKWAVRRHGYCLTKSGEWEWEPSPSGREDDFLMRCRFDTAREAVTAAVKFIQLDQVK